MNELEAVTVLAILLQDDDQADRMQKFLTQFPMYRYLALEQWQQWAGGHWED